MARYSLDTNTISGILKKDQRVVTRFEAVVTSGHELLICPIVYYELRRGLLWRDARQQMTFLQKLVSKFHWQDFDKDIWEAAAQEWANARKQGKTPPHMDFLIACHAMHFSAIVVTANIKDFEHFPVRVENWATLQ